MSSALSLICLVCANGAVLWEREINHCRLSAAQENCELQAMQVFSPSNLSARVQHIPTCICVCTVCCSLWVFVFLRGLGAFSWGDYKFAALEIIVRNFCQSAEVYLTILIKCFVMGSFWNSKFVWNVKSPAAWYWFDKHKQDLNEN